MIARLSNAGMLTGDIHNSRWLKIMTTVQTFKNTVVILATLAVAFVLVMSVRIIVVLAVAIIIASAVRPLVMRLRKARVPEGLAILFVYLGIALSLIVLAVGVLPPVINQLANYLQNEERLASRIIISQQWIEEKLTQVSGKPVILANPDDVRRGVEDFVDQIRATVPTVLPNLSTTLGEAVLVLIMGIYWLTARDKSVEFFVSLFPIKHRVQTKAIIDEIESSMGNYLRGIVFVGISVGLANFIILSILRVPNPGTLGFIIGVMTLLPVVGGPLGGIIATLLSLLSSPLNGVLTLATFLGVQAIETNILTPRTMSRSVGVDPLLIFLAVFIGLTLYGVIGAVIAVPIFGGISILIRRLIIEPRVAVVQNERLEGGAILLKAEKPPEPIVDGR